MCPKYALEGNNKASDLNKKLDKERTQFMTDFSEELESLFCVEGASNNKYGYHVALVNGDTDMTFQIDRGCLSTLVPMSLYKEKCAHLPMVAAEKTFVFQREGSASGCSHGDRGV